MIKIPKKEWREGNLKLIARKLGYCNQWPWNIGLYDGERLWGDCWCIEPKTILWAYACGDPLWDRYTVGEAFAVSIYNKGKELSGCPDWTGDALFNAYCEPVPFSQLVQSMDPALLLITGQHMGSYIGEYQVDVKTYNTVEFSPNDYINGTMRSYVTADGGRYDYKGGHLLGYWSKAGYFAGIDYTDNPEPTPAPKPEKPYTIDNLAVHIMRGDFENEPERTQKILALGYTEAEKLQAQDIVDHIYKMRDRDVLTTEIAWRLIHKEGGDGVTVRRQWVKDNYGDETLFDVAQKKINWYFEDI